MEASFSEHDLYYQALLTKDRRFDGKIFYGVRTTGIYCRPVCPARTPLRKNVSFHPTAASAEAAGFRPCLRCRPETSPGAPAWVGSSVTVSRALKLIGEGLVEREGLEGLIGRLGVGERQLRRLFVQHLGAPPQSVILTRRLDFARKLLDETRLPVSEIAFASGFESIRRFNDAFRGRFGRTPRETRKETALTTPERSLLQLRLPFRPPYDWKAIHGFLSQRAIPGVESCGGNFYRRTVETGGSLGLLEVSPDLEGSALILTVSGVQAQSLMEVVGRVRQLFDLEADPLAIAEQLSLDRQLRQRVRRHPGLRVPGAWSGYELAVRAILGQQISVAGARTLAGRIAQRFGKPLRGADPASGLTHLFPAPSVLAQADLTQVGLPRNRAETLRRLSASVQSGELELDGAGDTDRTMQSLLSIPGVGPWTAGYISMRALRNPDAFPATDLLLKRILNERYGGVMPSLWSPWSAYAALHLWGSVSERQNQRKGGKRK